MKVYPPRDIRPFVMYCVNGKPRSSLLIESTDSMIIGERSEPPLSVELSEFSLYLYIYIHVYIYIFIYIFQVVRRARAVNALRANVGPAG